MIRRSGVGFSLEHFLSTSLLASSASFYLDGMVSVACADALMVSDGVPMAGRSLRCTHEWPRRRTLLALQRPSIVVLERALTIMARRVGVFSCTVE